MRFFISLIVLFGCCLAGCDEEQLTGAGTSEFPGHYVLVRTTGGFAGVDTSYASYDSPQALQLNADGSLRLTSTEVTVVGNWSVEKLTRRGDTLSGTFLQSDNSVGFGGYSAQLIANRYLYLDGPCCDYFNYTYLKR